MSRLQLTELSAFVAVAEQRSFTRAAVQVGIAPPTMSQTIRALEDRLGVRLFNRTTRSVALTEAGERLLAEAQPILESVEHALESVNAFRDTPMGTLRLAAARPWGAMLLAPLVQPFLAEYPAIRLEVAFNDSLGDIVGGRFDAGVQAGHRVERDMTTLKILDAFRAIIVASPDYVARHGRPASPADLHHHNCIRYRLPWDGPAQPWVFEKAGEQTEIDVDGSLIVNDPDLARTAALDGVGIAYTAEPMIAAHLADGRLIALLEDWSRTLPGVYLFHPSRRQAPMPLQAFLKFVETWRRRPRAA